MTTWFVKNFSRVELERSAVEELIAEGWFQFSRWLIHEERLAVEGNILVDSVSYPIRLIYPDQFPDVPAWIVPQDSTAKWTSHQYGPGGTLCLEYRPDNWVRSITGADVTRSAFLLLQAENPLGNSPRNEVNSVEDISDIQSYDWYQSALLIYSECAERILAKSSTQLKALRFDSLSGEVAWPILLTDEEFRLQNPQPDSDGVKGWGTYLPVVPMYQERAEQPINNRDELAAIVAPFVNDQSFENVPFLVLFIGQYEITGYHCPIGEDVYERRSIILKDQQGLRSVHSTAFSEKKIAIVGVGSVGSKIAEILVRSGSRNLLLIDGDVFLPGNIERHVLDWRDVGFKKVVRLQKRLMNIAADANIAIIAQNLNWQRSARRHGEDIKALVDCELIIDATGDAGSTLMMGALASENLRSFISVEVFEGGIGALIARSVPNIDPPYANGRRAFHNFCTEQATPPPPSGRDRYQAFNNDGEPIVANDAAATTAASFATHIAIDVLEGNTLEKNSSWLLIGLKKAWLFDRCGHTILLDVGEAFQREEETPNEETLKFLMQLIEDINK